MIIIGMTAVGTLALCTINIITDCVRSRRLEKVNDRNIVYINPGCEREQTFLVNALSYHL